MILDSSRFGFVPKIEEHFATFLGELGQLAHEDFTAAPYEGSFDGDWRIFPLFFETFPSGLDDLFPRNQAKCPKSTKALRSIPRVISGGFSWIGPGCHIRPHTDRQPEDVLRSHLGLRIPPDNELKTATHSCGWSPGKCVVFDGSVVHEASNPSNEPRIILIVDTVLDADELAYLRSTRT